MRAHLSISSLRRYYSLSLWERGWVGAMSGFVAALTMAALVSFASSPLALAGTAPAASTDSAVASDFVPSAAEVLARAQAVMADAGVIKAEMSLDVAYPARYTSAITLYANSAGDERAAIRTMMKSNTVKTLEVITGGILYSEQANPVGVVVSRIDLNEVRKRVAAAKGSFAPVPSLGANAMFELNALAGIVDFSEVKSANVGEKAVYVVSGSLSSKYSEDGAKLPPGAARFYRSARVCVERDTFLPVSIELGNDGKGKPLLALAFTSIETGVQVPEGTFSYTIPPEAEVIDRTEWAIAELGGK